MQSGGPLYHFRHWRYSREWEPTRRWLAGELTRWNPSAKELVLIGPSAGYLLSPGFISRFEMVHRVDPDLLSHVLFQSRFPMARGQVSRKDYFSLSNPTGIKHGLLTLRRDFPTAAVLFCNIIGQLPVLLRERRTDPRKIEEYMAELAGHLHENFASPWASFHDLFSWDEKSLNKEGVPAEMRDHLTGALNHTSTCIWHLTPKLTHQIGFVAK